MSLLPWQKLPKCRGPVYTIMNRYNMVISHFSPNIFNDLGSAPTPIVLYVKVRYKWPFRIARFLWPAWAHLGPVGPRWAPCWPQKACYQGCYNESWLDLVVTANIRAHLTIHLIIISYYLFCQNERCDIWILCETVVIVIQETTNNNYLSKTQSHRRVTHFTIV